MQLAQTIVDIEIGLCRHRAPLAHMRNNTTMAGNVGVSTGAERPALFIPANDGKRRGTLFRRPLDQRPRIRCRTDIGGL